MAKADDSSRRGPGFDSRESLKTVIQYLMDVMINALITLKWLHKSDGQM